MNLRQADPDSGTAQRLLQEQAQEAVAARFSLVGVRHPLLNLLARHAVEDMMVRQRDNLPPPGGPPLFTQVAALDTAGLPDVADDPDAPPVPLDVDHLRIPALPQLFMELQNALGQPHVSYERIAAIVSKDPRLTASLLKLVNSPHFGFSTPIETVSRAVAASGIRRVSALALGTFVLGLYRERPPLVVDIQGFWLHSVGCGIAARLLAQRLGRSDPERFFVAGLLHDMGWLALCSAAPDRAERIVRRIQSTGCSCEEAERLELGTTHAELGATVLKTWNLPAFLIDVVRSHHAPLATVGDNPPVEGALEVHIADAVVKGMGIGGALDARIAPLDLDAVDTLGLSGHDIAAMTNGLVEQSQALSRLLQGD
ncbi:HDOD domain-containing protein [Nitratidesulfovibrio vulgaris]|jgi:HD-like signal output (HDOD) protein|uniref:Putative signal transduction protein n=1 Tax=Nitratidesulfovibrio vulgaris (strain DP4) TaxID=391774 RepID=A0A0H3A705_NITV4|nr:HDOD domain-containing protein [Nitratidesulfovibrio vulgaris]ABM27924.1 putative signal transduction protein [Nitratidesulfovibrio vulgaris DP4]WCB45873.1 HDOD domain-containing protein [Nitratidesulfovibrio vulgaris]GEB81094.1 HD domain-containing protein [Desulfovibrio desulfuricans]